MGLQVSERERNRSRSSRKYPLRPKTYPMKRRLALVVSTETKSRLPRTRAECTDGPRPCPHVGCRYHLFLDVKPETGNLTMVFPDLEPGDLVHSCALDVAEAGGATLEEVGVLLNLTRERVRQIEIIALAKVELGAKRF